MRLNAATTDRRAKTHRHPARKHSRNGSGPPNYPLMPRRARTLAPMSRQSVCRLDGCAAPVDQRAVSGSEACVFKDLKLVKQCREFAAGRFGCQQHRNRPTHVAQAEAEGAAPGGFEHLAPIQQTKQDGQPVLIERAATSAPARWADAASVTDPCLIRAAGALSRWPQTIPVQPVVLFDRTIEIATDLMAVPFPPRERHSGQVDRGSNLVGRRRRG
jgi:hypothetical protein